ncbi:13668_t:CDS:2 [Cetraspora pellucida]|uniref:13668_t:CDS:1 n=1 Tax=Cetraspora pellucida TaxID=1433469 RepID=A0A9N8VDZ7_9GLOM|nr:13668_t:CDS:2 [Cetraspora pellucida]
MYKISNKQYYTNTESELVSEVQPIQSSCNDISNESIILGSNNYNDVSNESIILGSDNQINVGGSDNQINQCQQPSRKINCSWHINLTKPKSLTEVGITSIYKEHNHPMLCDVELYASKYRKLTDSMMKNIKFYVTKDNMKAKQIYSLLVAKFSDYAILKKDIYNAIKRFKPPLTS